MSCPAWEDCNKKHCIETQHCRNPEYWASLSDHAFKNYKKMIERMDTRNPCTKGETVCDKRKTCEFLSQCIFTIEAVKGNKKLIKALSGKNSMKQVIDILRFHNPAPMRSYYLIKNKKS